MPYKNPNYQKEYYQKNKEKQAARLAQWLAENPDRRKDHTRKYREEHRASIREKYHRNKIEKTQSTPEEFLKKILGRIKTKVKTCHAAAKPKYQESDLTLEHLMELWNKQDGKCALTGKAMSHKFHSLYAVSVDRIDSTLGYMIGNVQLVCQSINYAKSNFTNQEFLYFWENNEEQS